MRSEDRPLDVMIVQRPFDAELPLDLAERLRIVMTVRSIPSGRRALDLIEGGARPDIILVDRRTPDLDVAALRRVLHLRTNGAATAISFIDGERAIVHDAETLEAIALVHARRSSPSLANAPEGRARLHDPAADAGGEDRS